MTLFSGNIEAIARYRCQVVDASGGNGTLRVYPCGQIGHAVQKICNLRCPVITVEQKIQIRNSDVLG